uniref:G_PROTEIN_RECEP_F1_2 domain-containing protein n=1 Tax=Anisakis simplex TaxID=6269 RepID=A0A0M3J641_ANISI
LRTSHEFSRFAQKLQSHSDEALHEIGGVVLAVSILALAFWDTILLWCAFFYYGLSALTRAHNSDTTKLLIPWFHGFSQIANTASIWCVVAITVQRFMASRDPFRCSRQVSHKSCSIEMKKETSAKVTEGFGKAQCIIEVDISLLNDSLLNN